jgi:hypothetical protein
MKTKNWLPLIEMATKVYGECDWHESALHHLEAFAKLVAAKEREACAKTVENLQPIWSHLEIQKATLEDAASAIRARGEA